MSQRWSKWSFGSWNSLRTARAVFKGMFSIIIWLVHMWQISAFEGSSITKCQLLSYKKTQLLHQVLVTVYNYAYMFLFSYFVYSQFWLNCLMNHHHSCYITKLKQKHWCAWFLFRFWKLFSRNLYLIHNALWNQGCFWPQVLSQPTSLLKHTLWQQEK